MNRTLRSSVPALALVFAACAGSSEAPAGSIDAGAGGVTCSGEAQCGDGACIGGLCVSRAESLGNLAIEIAPPLGRGAQLTEIPVAADALPSLTADAELNLVASFGGVNMSMDVPSMASAVLSVPSAIAGRPALVFSQSLNPMTKAATLAVPEGIRSRDATLGFFPVAPSDGTSPPYMFPLTIPAMGPTLPIQKLPANPFTMRGHIQDPFTGKGGFTARAFKDGVLVSSVASTSATVSNNAGDFVIVLPATTEGDVVVQVTADAGNDPWVTLKPITMSPSTPNVDIPPIILPVYANPNAFRLNVHGGDAMPISGATVRAFTTIDAEGVSGSVQFVREGTTGTDGNVALALIPGDTPMPRKYSLGVMPPPGSKWASQCSEVHVPYIGPSTPAQLLPDVPPLVLRPVLTRTVLSAGAAPVANVTVTATRTDPPPGPCLPTPQPVSATTDGRGVFTLPLDAGMYQIDYVPPTGSPVPRYSEIVNVGAGSPTSVQLPLGVLIEGDVRDAVQVSLADTTVRFFEPQCPAPDSCNAPILRALVQTDANGHFRAVVATSTQVK